MGKLTPGERAVNWAKALAVLCSALVALLGYTNKERIAKYLGPDDVVAVEATENDRNEKINAKFAEQDERMDKLEKRDKIDQYRLQQQIDEIKKLVN